MPIAKEILNMLGLGRKPSQVNLIVFLDRKLAKIAKDGCRQPHRKESSLCGDTPLHNAFSFPLRWQFYPKCK